MSRLHRLEEKLSTELHPTHLQVEDESHTHLRPGIESHFKIIAVSNIFNSLSLLARHRLVYDYCADELSNGLHALSLFLYTPEEWLKRRKDPETPACAGKKSSNQEV